MTRQMSRIVAIVVGVIAALIFVLWIYVQWETNRVTQFASQNLERTYHKHTQIINVFLVNARQYVWWLELPFRERVWNVEFVNPNVQGKQSAMVTRTSDGHLTFSFGLIIGGHFPDTKWFLAHFG